MEKRHRVKVIPLDVSLPPATTPVHLNYHPREREKNNKNVEGQRNERDKTRGKEIFRYVDHQYRVDGRRCVNVHRWIYNKILHTYARKYI